MWRIKNDPLLIKGLPSVSAIFQEGKKKLNKVDCFNALWKINVLNVRQVETQINCFKPALHVETFGWNLCATALRNKFQQALHRLT